MWDLGVRDDDSVLEFVGHPAQAGAQNDGDGWKCRHSDGNEIGGFPGLVETELAHISTPTMQAEIRFARVAVTSARTPSLARSLRR